MVESKAKVDAKLVEYKINKINIQVSREQNNTKVNKIIISLINSIGNSTKN